MCLQELPVLVVFQVSIFQDGYIDCSLIDNYGCEKCYREFEERIEKPRRNFRRISTEEERSESPYDSHAEAAV